MSTKNDKGGITYKHIPHVGKTIATLEGAVTTQRISYGSWLLTTADSLDLLAAMLRNARSP